MAFLVLSPRARGAGAHLWLRLPRTAGRTPTDWRLVETLDGLGRRTTDFVV
jgi:hypothetical protein